MRATYKVEVEVTAEVQSQADYSNEALSEALHDMVFAVIREETELDVVIMTVSPEKPAILITKEQAEYWAQRWLTDEQMAELAEAIPNSSVPEAIATIVGGMDFDDEEEEGSG